VLSGCTDFNKQQQETIPLTTLEIAKSAELSGEAKPFVRDDQKPEECARTLADNELFADAIALLAHSRDAADAIKWGYACLKKLGPAEKPGPDASLEAVEAWMEKPDDDKRRAAGAAAEESGKSRPSDLLALAVFFSGGSITDPDQPPADPPPFVANKMVAGSVQLSVVGHTPEENAERYRTAIQLAKS
jgi:hypothetical protein